MMFALSGGCSYCCIEWNETSWSYKTTQVHVGSREENSNHNGIVDVEEFLEK